MSSVLVLYMLMTDLYIISITVLEENRFRIILDFLGVLFYLAVIHIYFLVAACSFFPLNRQVCS